MYSYNNTMHSSTGYSPFYLLFGRHACLPLDVSLGIERDEHHQERLSDWVEAHHEELIAAHTLARGTLSKSAETRQLQYNKKVKNHPLLVGERVLLRNRDPKCMKKIDNKWNPSLYIIVEIPQDGLPVYKVMHERGEGSQRVVHRNELKPCVFQDTNEGLEGTDEPEDPNDSCDLPQNPSFRKTFTLHPVVDLQPPHGPDAVASPQLPTPIHESLEVQDSAPYPAEAPHREKLSLS